jgi:hypothetical protein
MSRKIFSTVTRSPVLTVLIIGLGLFLVLLLRGLDYGPLQTDVLIIRAWFSEVGAAGFSQRYFDVNQRHLLVGPIYSFAYTFFGEHNLPYNMIFHLSRVAQGVFLAGIVYQLTQRRIMAVFAGLGLLLTMIRVHELYQGINWYIEPTLALLLASSYVYLLSFRFVRARLWLVLLSATLYIISILIYESGLPWIAVNLFLGWIMRPNEKMARRIRLTIQDSLIPIVAGGLLTYLLLFVFVPWQQLAPDSGGGFLRRLLLAMQQIIIYPALVGSRIVEMIRDGYAPLLLIVVALAVIISSFLIRRSVREPETHTRREYAVLIALALIMFVSSLLVATSSQGLSGEYVDRITFGRAAGITLLYITLIFAASELLPSHMRLILAASISAVLVASGFVYLWMYQDVAQQSRAEIDRITAAVIDVRKTIYLPAHLVILTDPDWVVSKFTDASEEVLHEIQQSLYAANEPATIDFVRTGMPAETFEPIPGSCNMANEQRSGGICLDQTIMRNTRWAVKENTNYQDIVVLKWDAQAGILRVIPDLSVSALRAQGYNISSAGPDLLSTNRDRLAVPLP